MTEFTKDQIKRAKKLAIVLYGDELESPKFRKSTLFGVKTNTGIINTILNIMYGGRRWEKKQ